MKESSIDKMATSSSAGGSGELSLNVPRLQANEAYIILLVNTLNGFKQVIFTMTSITDPRIVPSARQCIINILDDDLRKKLLRAFARGVDYVQTRNDLQPAQKGELLIEVCQKAVAEVNSYFDEYVGLAKVNVIVPISSIPTKEEEDAARQILDSEGDLPENSQDQDEYIKAGTTDRVVKVDGMGIHNDLPETGERRT